MRAIKLYGTGSASANNVANVIIPSATRIVGVQVALRVDQVADNSALELELSLASANEVAVNGSQQSILNIGAFSNLVTSGLTMSNINQFFPVDVPMKQGQYLYLHAGVVTTTTYYFTGLIWLRD